MTFKVLIKSLIKGILIPSFIIMLAIYFIWPEKYYIGMFVSIIVFINTIILWLIV